MEICKEFSNILSLYKKEVKDKILSLNLAQIEFEKNIIVAQNIITTLVSVLPDIHLKIDKFSMKDPLHFFKYPPEYAKGYNGLLLLELLPIDKEFKYMYYTTAAGLPCSYLPSTGVATPIHLKVRKEKASNINKFIEDKLKEALPEKYSKTNCTVNEYSLEKKDKNAKDGKIIVYIYYNF